MEFCHHNKRLRINAYVIMPTHVHAIVFNAGFDPAALDKCLTDFRKFTGRQLSDFCDRQMPACFSDVLREKSGDDRERRFWQPGKHPEQIETETFWQPKFDYLHGNPCRKGLVRRAEWWRALVENVLGWVPVWGAARRALALARLTAALEALVSAGVSVIQAWEAAADASGSPALRRVIAAALPRMHGGEASGEVIAGSAVFPEMFVSLYQTGEMSGKLEDSLARLRDYYHNGQRDHGLPVG